MTLFGLMKIKHSILLLLFVFCLTRNSK